MISKTYVKNPQEQTIPCAPNQTVAYHTADNSVRGIIKLIHWPRFLAAIRYTAFSFLGLACIGTILYLYNYIISSFISAFV